MTIPHLDGAQMLDAVDGRLDAAVASHLAACASCSAGVDQLRAMMLTVGDAEVPEPSPLFWDHFPARVNRAIDASPEPRTWLGASRWLWGSAAAAGVVVVVLLLLPMRDDVAAPAPERTGGVAVVSVAVEPALEVEDYESDEAWAMVRAVAEDVDYDEVREVGLTPRAGSVERAAMELSTDERAELARLIEQDSRAMKQRVKPTGASTP